MQEKIIGIIEEYSEDGDFIGNISYDNLITVAEKELGFNIPSQYKWFIKNYGQGGIGAVQILGISKANRAVFKDITLEYRNYGLSTNLIVVENCDEWLYCIDINNGKIIAWDRISGVLGERYNTFLDFLADRFNDEIENM
ncbi:SMI1/KNR4 family protein [Clostridium sp. UBA6640]|uniref:SMI1/KNR4 family protein n=1 Tax=Clostridium sp. UBA6640 TaxID=1946370 RepID=UPI0025BB2287|nr:SMI1/KNR4 family protein [Clostridium sp. UBA6640]